MIKLKLLVKSSEDSFRCKTSNFSSPFTKKLNFKHPFWPVQYFYPLFKKLQVYLHPRYFCRVGPMRVFLFTFCNSFDSFPTAFTGVTY